LLGSKRRKIRRYVAISYFMRQSQYFVFKQSFPLLYCGSVTCVMQASDLAGVPFK